MLASRTTFRMQKQKSLIDIRTPQRKAESSGVFIRRWKKILNETGVHRPGKKQLL